jgi:hypothetical protein
MGRITGSFRDSSEGRTEETYIEVFNPGLKTAKTVEKKNHPVYWIDHCQDPVVAFSMMNGDQPDVSRPVFENRDNAPEVIVFGVIKSESESK